MTFSITARDINQATASGVCPVAAGMERTLGRPAILGHRFVTIGRRRYALPAFVTAAIMRWDRGRGMRPFRFELPIILGRSA